MKSRIDDIPKISTDPVALEALRFNRIRLGVLRIDNPLRIKLPGLRGMDLILDDQAWICVDRSLYDLPIMAWTDFQVENRSNLHKPVHCLLHIYHIHADLISETVLTTAFTIISDLIEKQGQTYIEA